ncbi:unnamed protein product [Schistocephalus solidus]|uniref:G_PROTEIN_RECEP_F1_2 domain-containing protein n=1 Tax=Schistocephalus solidus TaxID=70667 RepID=A0A183SHP1_SCHSO|nr:unnamed protein product [Schistocephalus solidus]
MSSQDYKTDCENAVLDSLEAVRSYIEKCFLNNTSKETFSEALLEHIRKADSQSGLLNIVLMCLASLYILMICIGFAGNMLVIIVVVCNRTMRSSPRNLFILNLAVSDLILCVFTQPLNLYRLLSFNQGWRLGLILCKLTSMVQGTNVFVSSMSITAIALDRCRLIMNPSRQDIRDKTVHTIIALLWIFAFILSTPLGVFATLSVNGSLDICSEVTLDYNLRITKVVYSVLMMLLLYGTPVALVSIAYAQICVMVHQRIKKKQQPQFKLSADGNISSNPNYALSECLEANRNFSIVGTTEPLEDTRSGNVPRKISRRKSDGGLSYITFHKPSRRTTDIPPKYPCHTRRSRKTSFLLGSIAVVFACSWLPINIVNLLLDLRDLKFEVLSINDTENAPMDNDGAVINTSSNILNHPLQRMLKDDKGSLSGELVIITQAVCLLCVLLSACVNPMLYGWLNENFQRHFKKILRCPSNDQSNDISDTSRTRARWPSKKILLLKMKRYRNFFITYLQYSIDMFNFAKQPSMGRRLLRRYSQNRNIF